ncbi:MAG: topoisomerase C-terminal repeat-containing protein, partial [Planctomycetota bacterium]
YVKWGKIYASLEAGDDVLTVGMNRAVDLIAKKAAKTGRGPAQKPMRELGDHPDGGPMNIMDGRYGPYIKWEKINATIPKEQDPMEISFDDALALVAAKAATKKKPRKKAAKKKAS